MPTTEGKRTYMYLKCGKDKITTTTTTTTTTTGQDRAGLGSTTLLAEPPSLLRNVFSARAAYKTRPNQHRHNTTHNYVTNTEKNIAQHTSLTVLLIKNQQQTKLQCFRFGLMHANIIKRIWPCHMECALYKLIIIYISYINFQVTCHAYLLSIQSPKLQTQEAMPLVASLVLCPWVARVVELTKGEGGKAIHLLSILLSPAQHHL